MIKLQAMENFTLERFGELQNIKRKNPNKNEKGKLYENDEFECNKDLADYLLGANALNRAVVKIIEIIPEVKKEVVKESKKVIEEKPKTSKKKKTSKK